MNKWTLVIGLILTSFLGFSQKIEVSKERIVLPEGFKIDVSLSNSNQYSHSGWLPGIFFYPNGTSRNYDQIKFNQFSSQAKVIVEGTEVDVLPNLLTGIIIKEDDLLGFVYVVLDFEGQSSFYEVLSNGKYILLSHMQLKETEKKDAHTLGVTLRFEAEQEIVDVDEQWFVLENGEVQSLKTSQKGVAKATGVDKKVIESFVAANNLTVGNRNHLALLFDYLNTL